MNQYLEQASLWFLKFFVTIKEPTSVPNITYVTWNDERLVWEKSKLEESVNLKDFYPFELVNILGKNICNNCNKVDLSNLPNGICFLKRKNKITKVLIVD